MTSQRSADPPPAMHPMDPMDPRRGRDLSPIFAAFLCNIGTLIIRSTGRPTSIFG